MTASLRVVGVDAGGSHTEAVVTDDALTEIKRARGPAGALRADAVPAAADAIAAVITAAVPDDHAPAEPGAVVVGAAGAGADVQRLALERELARRLAHVPLAVTTDADIALEAAFGQRPGVLINAGSGSIAFARAPGGAIHRVGGHGWQAGDEGSGYALGRAGVAAAGRAADGRGPGTALVEAILGAVGATTQRDLVDWANAAARQEIAALAAIVQTAAREGDRVAIGLTRRAAADLLAHVSALVGQFAGAGDISLALAGGVLSPGTPVREDLLVRIAESMPRVRVVPGAVDPPIGAAAIALRLARSGG